MAARRGRPREALASATVSDGAGTEHGTDEAEHPEHAGDLPTLLVTGKGTAELDVTTDDSRPARP